MPIGRYFRSFIPALHIDAYSWRCTSTGRLTMSRLVDTLGCAGGRARAEPPGHRQPSRRSSGKGPLCCGKHHRGARPYWGTLFGSISRALHHGAQCTLSGRRSKIIGQDGRNVRTVGVCPFPSRVPRGTLPRPRYGWRTQSTARALLLLTLIVASMSAYGIRSLQLFQTQTDRTQQQHALSREYDRRQQDALRTLAPSARPSATFPTSLGMHSLSTTGT